MTDAAAAELAPSGTLRAAINLSNFLLVTGRDAVGDPVGVAPDMARAIADALGVGVRYVPYARPSLLADAGGTGEWDIGLIGAEPARAEKIAFTAAYCEIASTYLVPPGSPIASIAEVDRPGLRIAVMGGSAYGLWLDRNIRHATLLRGTPERDAWTIFTEDGADALAGLRPGLLDDAAKLPGARVLDGQFAAVQQAVGTDRRNESGAAFLRDFVERAKASGLVAELIAKHGVPGRLSVAPPG